MTLTGKQAKSIIRHILHHISNSTTDPQITLTDQDLIDHQERLTNLLHRVESNNVQRRIVRIYELLEHIRLIRHQIKEEKIKAQQRHNTQ